MQFDSNDLPGNENMNVIDPHTLMTALSSLRSKQRLRTLFLQRCLAETKEVPDNNEEAPQLCPSYLHNLLSVTDGIK